MKTRNYIFISFVFLISSCGTPNSESPQPPNKDILTDEVIHKAFAQLKTEKELYPFGVGSRMMDQIKMLALSFRYYKEVDIEQARELVLTAATVFLKIINSNDQIRPFLDNYPFKPKNIDIAIFLQKQDGSEPNPGKLTVVSMKNGVIEYMVSDPETSRLQTVYQESFEEADAKLHFGVK